MLTGKEKSQRERNSKQYNDLGKGENTMNERIDALREFLMSEGYIKDSEELTYEVEDNCFSTSFGEYLVLTDDEAEEKTREEIVSSMFA